jgi:hypothetical protein
MLSVTESESLEEGEEGDQKPVGLKNVFRLFQGYAEGHGENSWCHLDPSG